MEIRTFPNEVFARLAPDVYFKRHLEKHTRPTGRKYLERRPINVKGDDEHIIKGSLGSAVVNSGNASVICGITAGLTNFIGEGGIYANVEIPRGSNSSVPSGEEQVTTMAIHRLIESALIPQANFFVSEQQELCLRASITVLSRTGPALDLIWECLVAALRNTRVPVFEEDERTLNMVASEDSRPLELPSTLAEHIHTYGFVGDEVFADIDGPIEEEEIIDRVSIARTADNVIMAVSLDSPNGCSLSTMERILSHDAATSHQ